MEERWPALLAFLAKSFVDESDSAASQNTLGRAYLLLKLPSLAYRSFQTAAKDGVSVAKSNMASLIHAQPVPAAGLEILESHSGPFDAASQSFPHHVRAMIEESIENELKRANDLRDRGRSIARYLTLLAELALADPIETDLKEEMLLAIRRRTRDKSNANRITALVEGNAEDLNFQRLLPSFNLWAMREKGRVVGFFYASEQGEFSGFRVDLSADDGALTSFVNGDDAAPTLAATQVNTESPKEPSPTN